MEEKPKRSKASAKKVSARSSDPKPAPAKSAAKASAKQAAAKAAPKATATPEPAAPRKPAAAKASPPKAASSPARPRARSAAKPKIPAILQEGDRPAAPQPSGPGQRYDLGVTSTREVLAPVTELPEAYGTMRLLLTARDPHWLYAHWDMTVDQLKEHNLKSRDGHLVVRVFKNDVGGKPVVEQHVHPESRNWFLHVPLAGTLYVAQLGYYDRSGTWSAVSTSTPTMAPPDALSSDTSVRFETIPVEVPFKKLLQVVRSAVAEHVPLVQALEQLRAEGVSPGLPVPERIASASWTPEQERALAQVINIDSVRRVWMGSLEITELIRRKLEEEISSISAAALARGEQFEVTPGGVSSISSPFGGQEKQRGFWFNVNAELIIYGSTEPNASVTIGGRPVQLRPDGSFSFRFALPDGQYHLPIAATSPDKVETRHAELSFRRATAYRGDVGVHPQDAALKPPRVENVA